MKEGLFEPMPSKFSVHDHQVPCSGPVVQQCKVANLV